MPLFLGIYLIATAITCIGLCFYCLFQDSAEEFLVIGAYPYQIHKNIKISWFGAIILFIINLIIFPYIYILGMICDLVKIMYIGRK